jgi:hypothetical protein
VSTTIDPGAPLAEDALIDELEELLDVRVTVTGSLTPNPDVMTGSQTTGCGQSSCTDQTVGCSKGR